MSSLSRGHLSAAEPARRGRSTKRWVAASIALLVGTIGVRGAEAADDPTLDWYTYETAHFRVHYPEPLDPIARRVALLSETIHGRLSTGMHFAPSEKTEILLTDDSESANGVATPVPYDNIRLYATAPNDLSTLGDYDDWLLGLVTHEYTHILHTDNISGSAAIANRIIGKTLAPNSAQPRWIIEGLAVVEESQYTSGGRVRSNLFDMLLRADVLEGNFARLDQISANAQRWPFGNLWYLYGSRFLRWIVDIYGPDTMPAVSADYGATTAPFGINRAIRRVTGRTYEDLYDGWHDHLRRHYDEQIRAVDALGRREGVRITFHGRDVLYPRFVPAVALARRGEDEIVYYRADQNAKAGFYRFTLGAVDHEGKRDEALVVRLADESSVTFTPEGDYLFSDLAFYKNLYSRADLFSLPKDETSTLGTEHARKRLSTGWRASTPDVSPDGHMVAFSVDSRSTSFLSIARVDDDGTLGPRRTLVPSARFEQAYTPRFSPDGKTIAYSVWTEGGYRDIRLVDVATGRFENVTHDRAIDLEPAWSPDGKTLYFSSDRSNIFNIYAYDLATKQLSLVTNVHNGALAPAISSDGTKLVYTGYTHEGYDLFAMRIDRTRFLPAPPPPTDRPAPLPEPESVKIEKHSYNPLPTFGPRNYLLSLGQGYYSNNAVTFQTTASDIVGHHSMSAQIVFDPGAPAPRFSIDYVYGGLPVSLGVGVSRSVVPHKTGYRVGDQQLPWDETLSNLYSTVSVPVRSQYVDQAFGITYTAQKYSGDLPAPTTLDPYATRTILPPQGFLSQVRASYSLSTVDGSTEAAGSIRGVALRVGTTYAGPELGSDSTLYAFDAAVTGFIPMPWPGYQTLALRAGGGVSGGDYAKRGLYFVGGYDLAKSGFIDSVLNGTYDGAFVLRGYGPGEFSGSEYLQSTIEYRAPLWVPNWGPSTLPIFLKRFDAAAFVDYAGAFDRLQIERARLFHQGDLIYLPDLHASVGGEIWTTATLAHRIELMLRLGYAYGFSSAVYKHGQLYFLAASAF